MMKAYFSYISHIISHNVKIL